MVAHPEIDSSSTIPGQTGIWKCWFLRRGENLRKTSRSKGENQQQTQLINGIHAWILTRATLVGCECYDHFGTLCSPELVYNRTICFAILHYFSFTPVIYETSNPFFPGLVSSCCHDGS